MGLRYQIAAATNLVLLLSISSLTNSDLISDANALLEFVAKVPHARKLNWNSTNSICNSWIGITCTKDKTRVHTIRLPGIGLYGPIPYNTIGRLDALKTLSLRSNYLNGNLPQDILEIPSLQSLFLQNNNFSGELPLSISSRLSIIDLSYNSFTGEIPFTFGNLTRLSVLNLEHNSFSGVIPNLDLPRLEKLNLSYNSLNGPIPYSLQKFPFSAFEGNARLCGQPLTSCSALSPSPMPENSSQGLKSSNSRKLSSHAIIALAIVGGSLLFLLVSAIVFFSLKKKKDSGKTTLIVSKASTVGKNENLKSADFGSGVQGSEKNKLTFFDGCSFSFDLEDLLRASAEVLGKGTHGTAYKAILDESTTVVVKRLKEIGAGKKEFEQQMEGINVTSRHPNVVPLLAYYFSKDEKLLVYQYMPAGSLSSALHGNRGTGKTTLDWETRLNISLGAAKGLAHIHSENGEKNTHGNIKSSNILLNESLEGCISDFGLNPITNHHAAPPVKYRVAGYRAPEVIESRVKFASQKSDVYSFGVVLLEILTGKSPIQYLGYDEVVVDLPRWVRSVVREEWTAEVFDVELMKYRNIEEEMVQLLQIGLSCVAKVAEMRPSMDEVVRMIEDIRGEKFRTSSEDNRSKDSTTAPTP